MRGFATIALLGLLCSPLPSRAAAAPATPALQWPDTDRGRHVRAWFEGYAQGEAAMRTVYRDHYSAAALANRSLEDRLGGYRQMRENEGALSPVAVSEQGDAGVQVMVRTADGRMLAMTFECEPQAPHRLMGIRVNLTDDPGGAAPGAGPGRMTTTGPPLTDEQAVAAMRRLLDGAAQADSFSGAVLLARDGKPLLRQAWGQAERRFGSVNRPETRFNLGSVNKIITKLAIAQLAEQGKLTLEDPLTKWIKDWPGASASKITIAMLVAHRAGIGDFFNEKYDAADRSALRHNRDFIPLFRDQPLWFEPGTSQRYSNGSYVLLGEIVARASGQDYYEYVRDHIYAPAGMKASASLLADEPAPDVAMGYSRGENGGEPMRENAFSRPARGSAAGGGYSTVDDMLRLDQALIAHRLCSAGWTAWVIGGPAPSATRAAAAAGAPVKPSFGFAGGAPGISAEWAHNGALTLIVLGNFDPPYTQAMVEQLSGLMRRMKD